MRTGPAFEFAGKMASRLGNSSHSDTDAKWDLFDNGIGLLDTVESIVNLWGAKQKTRLLKDVYSSRVFTDFLEKHQKIADKELKAVEKYEREATSAKISTASVEAKTLIALAKSELKQQREKQRLHYEQLRHSAVEQFKAKANEEDVAKELRNLFFDSIKLAKMTSQVLADENKIKNNQHIARLDEEIRKTTALLQKSLKGSV